MNAKSAATVAKWFFALIEVIIAVWAFRAIIGIIGVGTRIPHQGAGAFWFGGIGLNLDPGTLRLFSPTLGGSTVTLDNVYGSVGIDLIHGAPLIKPLLTPLCLVVLCRVGMLLVICDLFRRMFQSVGRREVFSRRNVRRIRNAGLLVIGLSLGSAVCGRAYGVRAWGFVEHNIAVAGPAKIEARLPPSQGMSAGSYMIGHTLVRIDEDGIMIGTIIRFDLREILLGLGLISFAAALGQGLALQEESELTV